MVPEVVLLHKHVPKHVMLPQLIEHSPLTYSVVMDHHLKQSLAMYLYPIHQFLCLHHRNSLAIGFLELRGEEVHH